MPDAFTVEVRTARWVELLEQGSVTCVTDGGFCSVIRPARDASAPVELAALYVAPSRWRRGVGRALVDTALARDEDVTVWVFAQNDRARRFYAALVSARTARRPLIRFYVVWAVAGSLGPIILIVSLLNGTALWWIGLLLCIVWVATLGIDWLLVRRLQRDSPGWTPWEPRGRCLRK